MAMTTTADLSSVGISLDHIACTSGPLLFPQHGDHPHHRGFGGGLSPECRISSPSFLGLDFRYSTASGRFSHRLHIGCSGVPGVPFGQARVHDLDRLRCSLAAGHREDGATDHVWWMCFTRRGPGGPCARTKRAQEPLALTADPTSQVRGRVVLDEMLVTFGRCSRLNEQSGARHVFVHLLRRWTMVVVASVTHLMPAATGPLLWFAAMVLRFVSRTTSHSVRSEERRVGKECRSRW